MPPAGTDGPVARRRRWVVWALAAAVVLGLAVRLQPLLRFAVWGSDTGEYFLLTERLVSAGSLVTGYNGWGVAYPWFPGMFLLTGGFVTVTGAPLFPSLVTLTPAVAALTIPLAFLIGLEAFDDHRAGLVAAGFMGTSLAQTVATSHAMPGALADPLVALCLLLFLRAGRDHRAALAFLPAAGALVVTHHLSTFYVLVPVVALIAVRELIQRRSAPRSLLTSATLATFLVLLTLVQWLVVARPFRDDVLTEAGSVPPVLLVVGGLAATFVAAAALVLLRRRTAWTYVPAFPSYHRVVGLTATMSVSLAIVVGIVLFVGVPGTALQIPPASAAYLLPTAALGPVALVGVSRAEFSRDGLAVFVWLGALTAVLIAGAAVESHLLLPYRQMQYVVLPVGLAAGGGVAYLIDLAPSPRTAGRALGAGCVAIVVAGAAAAEPPKSVLGNFEEGTTQEELDAVLWTVATSEPGITVATDHRLSSLLFGFGTVNATWDSAGKILHGSFEDAAPLLARCDTPSGPQRIDSVLLSDSVRDSAALVQWETARPISPEAAAKFEAAPFLAVYANGGAELYRVAV